MTCSAVILAAGRGTRVATATPKVLHHVAGWPLVKHVVATAREAECDPIIVVTSRHIDVSEVVGNAVQIARQPEHDHGTAAAVQAANIPDESDTTIVMYADSPLLTASTVRAMSAHRRESKAAVVVGWTQMPTPGDYGRVVMNPDGSVKAIVESIDADADTYASTNLNAGVMAFETKWLTTALPRVALSPRSNERYLTATVQLANEDDRRAVAHSIADPTEIIGCDTLANLAEAEVAMQNRLRRTLPTRGVQMQDPTTTYLHRGVTVAAGTILLPGTSLEGHTTIGPGSTIGPNTRLIDSVVGSECVVESSRIIASVLGNCVCVGPFAHVREECAIGDGSRIGTHAELKSATIGRNVHVHHFSYLGDVNIGDSTNIGAGTVTCNFDGADKHKTVIGARAFIGSGSMLIAPVTVADDSRTAAGAVVNRDVPPGKLAIGMPARIRR